MKREGREEKKEEGFPLSLSNRAASSKRRPQMARKGSDGKKKK